MNACAKGKWSPCTAPFCANPSRDSLQVPADALNSHDYGRIEAALRFLVEDHEKRSRERMPSHPKSLPAILRTLDKVERINGTEDYTPQWPGGPTLKELDRARARAKKKAGN